MLLRPGIHARDAAQRGFRPNKRRHRRLTADFRARTEISCQAYLAVAVTGHLTALDDGHGQRKSDTNERGSLLHATLQR